MPSEPPPTHAIRFDETAFYVVHRRREFGPFDYQWTLDLRGVELTYRGLKYGEFWSTSQMHVDLREFRLPQRVLQVAMLVLGAQLESLRQGDSVRQRTVRLAAILRQFGCLRFADSLEQDPA